VFTCLRVIGNDYSTNEIAQLTNLDYFISPLSPWYSIDSCEFRDSLHKTWDSICIATVLLTPGGKSVDGPPELICVSLPVELNPMIGATWLGLFLGKHCTILAFLVN